MEDGKMVMNDE